MAAGKKPVGRAPICDPAYLRRIDPVWVPGPVPFRYWQEPAHRRDYLLWLGGKLRFRYMEDWYKLTHEDIKHNSGAGLAVTYWRASAIEGVQECFPEYDWQEWRFARAPQGFWKVCENRHRYMRWLRQRLGCRQPEDWYAVRQEDFVANFGRECIKHYRMSPALAAMDLFPGYAWQEWKFQKTPSGFWHRPENRKRYVQWLGERLGFRRPADWRQVRWQQFLRQLWPRPVVSRRRPARAAPRVLPGSGLGRHRPGA
jgi:hypothetical protein